MKNKLEFKAIPENFENYNQFLSSINWNKLKDNSILWPVLKHNKFQAILGSEHQVLTLRREILFNYSPTSSSLTKMGNYSEMNYVDLPIDLSNGLRLSTYNYYAHHMGNEVENWMLEIFKNLTLNSKKLACRLDEMKFPKKNMFIYKLRKKLLKVYIKKKTPGNYPN